MTASGISAYASRIFKNSSTASAVYTINNSRFVKLNDHLIILVNFCAAKTAAVIPATR